MARISFKQDGMVLNCAAIRE